MIPRYSRPEMTKIWSQENKYNIWFDIEIYALEALEKLGALAITFFVLLKVFIN
jgi:adenylosuccinate lyase